MCSKCPGEGLNLTDIGMLFAGKGGGASLGSGPLAISPRSDQRQG